MSRLVPIVEQYEPGTEYEVWGIGDLHLGALDCHEELLRRHVKRIAENPHARWIHMGDAGELIDYRDVKRFRPNPLPERYMDAMMNADGGMVTETREHFCEIFEPIAGKCWGFLDGNHETNIMKRYSRSLSSEICAQLGIESRYIGYGGFIRVRLKRASSQSQGATAIVLFDCHHGWQGGRRPGAKVNQLELELGRTSADVIMRGHCHDRGGWKFPAFRPGDRYVQDWVRVGLITGTYKVGDVEERNGKIGTPTYELERGYVQKVEGVMGAVRLVIRPSSNGNEGPGKQPVEYEIRT